MYVKVANYLARRQMEADMQKELNDMIACILQTAAGGVDFKDVEHSTQ